jgi:CBS domain-containing protein
MHARDVMIFPVITVKPSATVKDVAKLLIEKRISAVPVTDERDKVVGIVSESDLLHRTEAGTERQRSWWLRELVDHDKLAAEYIKSHAARVSDIMTRKVITAAPDTPLHDIATLMEKHAIKRVPVVEHEQLVGIISRSNLVQAVASARQPLTIPLSDTAIRDSILSHLRAQPWAHTSALNVMVNGGVVDLWGFTESELERKAIRVAAESTTGVCAVNDNLVTRPLGAWT